MKFIGPNEACREVDLPSGRRLRQSKGVFHAESAAEARLLKKAGFAQGAEGFVTSGATWVCTVCGRRTVIRTCGRCEDAPCVKEEC